MATTKSAQKPSKAKLLKSAQAWLALQAQRRKLSARLDAIGREQGIHLKAAAACMPNVGQEQLPGGITVRALYRRGKVSWKDAYIENAGAERAIALQEAAPKKRVVVIEAS